MKIVVATPLYPPDIAEPAPYGKELARRLAGRYDTTVVTYGRLPEAVPGVALVAVDKRRPLPLRLLSYTRALLSVTRGADYLYVLNGPSVELPAVLVSTLRRIPIIFALADTRAHKHASRSLSAHILEQLAMRHARYLVRTFPPPRPEILPLEVYPTEAMAAYDAGWQEHLKELSALFPSHA